jgi:hypothetical protein
MMSDWKSSGEYTTFETQIEPPRFDAVAGKNVSARGDKRVQVLFQVRVVVAIEIVVAISFLVRIEATR